MFIEKTGNLQGISSNNFEALKANRQDFAPISPLTSSRILANHNKTVKSGPECKYKQRLPRHIRGCKYCGEIETKLGPGNQNRPVSLNCAAFGHFWRWMGHLEFELYQRKNQNSTAPRQSNIFEGGEGGL